MFAIPAFLTGLIASPIGRALMILAAVAMAYVYVDARARNQERAACNSRAVESQRAAEQIDKRAADNAGKTERIDSANIDKLFAENRRLIDELKTEREKPPVFVKGETVRVPANCPPVARGISDRDLERLRRIPER